MTSLDQTLPDVEAATARRLLEGLGARLRTAYEQGVELDELAAACRRSPATVRRLLEAAGTDLPPLERAVGAGSAGPGPAGPLHAAGAGAGAAFVRVPEPTDTGARTRRARMPTPARGLGRTRGEERPGTWAEAPSPPALLTGAAPAGPAPAESGSVETESTGSRPAGGAGAAFGVLIAGSPAPPAAVARRRRAVSRVEARPMRIGRGTSLVVVPAWRESIAVSVPTASLVESTGLSLERLASARLSVLVDLGAVHDGELDAHGWRVEPDGSGAA
ncbi:hypothetical protein [Kitasatospora camelliae]|uniref:Uncharacterized protein n=1 Tax=Kitasatospora camelliae TaxID=3156397 RepID=A0AAU8JTR1_9ACTN